MIKIVEHKICVGCQYNSYPVCRGTIMPAGNEMNIENLKPNFKCGQKTSAEIKSFVKVDKIQDKLNELENRIQELEAKQASATKL